MEGYSVIAILTEAITGTNLFLGRSTTFHDVMFINNSTFKLLSNCCSRIGIKTLECAVFVENCPLCVGNSDSASHKPVPDYFPITACPFKCIIP